MNFYLGTHRPTWLGRTSVPLFVSRRTMPQGDVGRRALGARRSPPLDGCEGHKNCANCLRYALEWRTELLAKIALDTAPVARHTPAH